MRRRTHVFGCRPIQEMSMTMLVQDPDAIVWSLPQEYTLSLETGGYGNVPETKMLLAIGQIIKLLRPQALKVHMNDITLCRKEENFHKNDFNEFM